MELMDTVVVRDGSEVNLVEDSEFKQRNPQYTEEQQQALAQKAISDNRIVDPLVVWEGKDTLVYGYEEYAIAQKYNLPFTTMELAFETKTDVMAWITEKRIAQPSITNFERVELALPFGEYWKEKAAANRGRRNDLCKDTLEKFEKVDVLNIVATKAGVCRNTVAKVQRIFNSDQESLIEKCRAGEMSITAADDAISGSNGGSVELTPEEVAVAEKAKKERTNRKKMTEVEILAEYYVDGFTHKKEKLDDDGLKWFVYRWNEEHPKNKIKMGEVKKAIKDFGKDKE